jgi:hypothetical protein
MRKGATRRVEMRNIEIVFFDVGMSLPFSALEIIAVRLGVKRDDEERAAAIA